MSIHQGQPVLKAGKPLEEAKGVMIMLHGRGARAEDILTLAPQVHQEFAFLAPQAAGNQWYPFRFMEPRHKNEPFLTSALDTITDLVNQVMARGFVSEQIMLLGFSQGACLAIEWAVRNPRRYGGVMVLSGGLIGDQLEQPPGSMENTLVFFGCSENDPHIPETRFYESVKILEQMGADVTKRLYPKLGHTVNHDEMAFVHGVAMGVVRGENR